MSSKENTENGLIMFCFNSIILLMSVMLEMNKRIKKLENEKEDNNDL